MFTPPPPAPQRGDRATFSSRVDAFLTWLAALPAQLYVFLARLEVIAAGGAYAISYTLEGATSADSDPGPGRIRFGNAVNLSASTVLHVDDLSSAGANVSGILLSLNTSTSAVKSRLRIVSPGQPESFLTFDVMGIVQKDGYFTLTIASAWGSTSSPFAADQTLVLHFDRTGDKGNTGPMNVYPYAEFLEQHASGVAPNGGSLVTGVYDRALNTVAYNNIPGASLSAGTVTLQPGFYEFEGMACIEANANSYNKILLANITDAFTWHGTGTGAAGSGAPVNLFSHISGRFQLTDSKAFKLRTAVGPVSTRPGGPINSGYPEIYASFKVWKLA